MKGINEGMHGNLRPAPARTWLRPARQESWVASIFETKYRFVRLGIEKPATDDALHIGGILAQSLKNPFLLRKANLQLGQSVASAGLLAPQLFELAPGLPEEPRRHYPHHDKKAEIYPDDQFSHIDGHGIYRRDLHKTVNSLLNVFFTGDL